MSITFKWRGKVANWPIVEGKPRFVAMLNSNTGQVGQGPILLLYDQTVSVSKIKEYVRVYDSADKKLDINIFNPDYSNIDYISNIDIKYMIAVTVRNLPANGKHVRIEFPSWKQKDSLEIMQRALTVNSSFILLESGFEKKAKNNTVPLNATLELNFNNRYDLMLLKQLIKISPQPKSFYISGYGYDMDRIYMELEPGKEYRVYTDKLFVDLLGNPLEKLINFKFTSQDLSPLLEVPKIPIKVRNLEQLEIRVVQFDTLNDFIKAYTGKKRNSAKEYGLTGRGSVYRVAYDDYKANLIQFFDIGIDNTVGLKCVEISGRGVGSEADGSLTNALLMQSTNIGITSKIFEGSIFSWVTKLDKAEPLSKAIVSLYDENASRVSTAVSVSDGTVVLDAKEITKSADLSRPLVVVVKYKEDTAISRIVNQELSNAWQFGLPGVVEGWESLHAAVFTERGIYRPGEDVHLKIILSRDMLRSGKKIGLQINDPRGQQVVHTDLLLDSFYAAHYELTLKEKAPVGEYLVQVNYEKYRSISKFQVEEYRVPTFIVTVSSKDKTWKRARTVTADVSAEYVHGSSLLGRKVDWRVYRQLEQFYVRDLPGFVFSLESDASLTGFVTHGSGRLNAEGKYVVNFAPDHPSSAGSMRYTLEASVTDVDRQNYAGSVSKLVHPANFYIGAKPPPKDIMAQGDLLAVPVIVVDHDGKPLSGITVKAILERIDYHKTARMSDYGDVQVNNRSVPVVKEEKIIRSGKAAVICSFNLEQAGYFQLRFEAIDNEGHLVQTGFKIAVSGENTAAWPRFDKEQIEIIADKKSYEPGDKAVLVVQSPYKNATGLLTAERNGILTHKLFYINNNTPEIVVPIEGEYAPNVYVSVVVIRGRVHHKKDASGFKIGYVNLEVTPAEQRLSLDIKTNVETANPGQELRVDLFVKDFMNRPAEGQATIMVVDEAVLSLTGYKTPDPIKQAYIFYPLGIRTASSLLDLPHSRRSRREALFPGGGGGMFLEADSLLLRKLFKSTAYWNPDVDIGKNGRTSIVFTLPDNITTYRIMVVVTDTKSRMGSADTKIICQKPLMIQPVLPRFFYPGDELTIEALLFNGTNSAEYVQLWAEFEGLRLASGDAYGKLRIEANSSGSFKFRIKAEKAEKAVIRFRATTGKHMDAAQFELPILEPGSRRVIVKNISVSATDELDITIPADRITGSAQIEVVTSSTVLSELKDSVQYLMHYPNGCIEQTTSTAYPLVVLKDLLPEMGIEVSMEDLKKFSEAGVRRILSFQTEAGGLSYWPGGSEPHAFATAFGLSFLAIAVKEMPGDKSLLQPILAEIQKATEVESSEAYYSGQAKGGWSFDSPLRTHGGALIAYALANLDPEMSGKLLTGLLKRRSNGLWGNTQENVFGIMGVHSIALNKAGGGAPQMELKVNNRIYTESEMEKTSVRVRRLTLTEKDVGFISGREGKITCTLTNKSGTPVFLTVRVRYDVPLSEKNRESTANGFSITRKYETLEGASLEGKTIPLGSLVRVRLIIHSDGDHHYCAFDDKLPAGLEPLNVNLKTTEKVYQGELTATAQRSLSVLSYSEIRDSRVAFYVDELLRGDYEFNYVARATTPGTFLRPAGRAEAMYQPQIFGTTTIDYVIIQ